MRAAAETFRANPELDTERVILELKVGEALVSMLENKGEPSIVQRTLIRPPEGRIGPVTEAERRGIIAASPFNGKYETVENAESAEEMLAGRAAAAQGGGSLGRRRRLERHHLRRQGSDRAPPPGRGRDGGRELQRSFSRSVGVHHPQHHHEGDPRRPLTTDPPGTRWRECTMMAAPGNTP